MIHIDLNSDLGESYGTYIIGNDEKILNYVTSVNIACGYHAGDPAIMERTVKAALEKGVAIGAHPGYPDLMGFGRRNMSISPEEARAYIIYQVGALNGFIKAYGGRLQHVKPHGALYNNAARDYKLAKTIAEAVHDIDGDIVLLGLANSEMIKAAEETGLRTANEVFADRAYNSDGTLVSRKLSGAVIHDPELCLKRVLKMVCDGLVTAIDGTDVPIKADSVCLHGDNIMAVEFAEILSSRLTERGICFKNLR